MNPSTLYGMKVVVSPLCDNQPKMQLSPKFASMMPASFVAETNDWMLKFFGTEDRFYVMNGGQSIAMGPNMLKKLRAKGVRI